MGGGLCHLVVGIGGKKNLCRGEGVQVETKKGRKWMQDDLSWETLCGGWNGCPMRF